MYKNPYRVNLHYQASFIVLWFNKPYHAHTCIMSMMVMFSLISSYHIAGQKKDIWSSWLPCPTAPCLSDRDTNFVCDARACKLCSPQLPDPLLPCAMIRLVIGAKTEGPFIIKANTFKLKAAGKQTKAGNVILICQANSPFWLQQGGWHGLCSTFAKFSQTLKCMNYGPIRQKEGPTSVLTCF